MMKRLWLWLSAAAARDLIAELQAQLAVAEALVDALRNRSVVDAAEIQHLQHMVRMNLDTIKQLKKKVKK